MSFIELWLLCSTVMNKNGSSMHNNIMQHALVLWAAKNLTRNGVILLILAEHQKVASYPNESLFMNVPYILASKHGCKI